jgi:hypothetical protein
VPAGTPGGAYNLFFVVNGNNAVAESALGAGTVNNVLAVPVTVSTTDLAVTAPATATTSLGLNAKLGSVSTFVQNETALTYSAGYTLNLYIVGLVHLGRDRDAVAEQHPVRRAGAPEQRGVQLDQCHDPQCHSRHLLPAEPGGARRRADGRQSLANNVATTGRHLGGFGPHADQRRADRRHHHRAGGSFTGLTYQLNNLNAGVIPAGTPLLVQTFLSHQRDLQRRHRHLLDSYTYSGGIAAGPAAVALPPAPRTINVPAGTAGGRLQPAHCR